MTATINASTSSGVVITPDNSGTVALQGAGTTGLTVNSSGYVLTPVQPIFSVRKTNGSSTNAAQIIEFNAIDTNISSSYATSGGRFTAPVAGTYLFIFSGASTATADFRILKNGTTTGYHAYAAGTNVAATYNAALTLSANDYIQIESINAYRGDTHNMFCGFLIG